MLRVCRSQEQRRRVHGAARDDDQRRLDANDVSVPFDLDRLDPAAACVDEQPPCERVGPERHGRTPDGVVDAADFGVALRVNLAREGIAGAAQDAATAPRRVAANRAATTTGCSPSSRSRSTMSGHDGRMRNRRRTETGSAEARSGRRRAALARGTDVPRGRSTAPASHNRSATPARCRRRVLSRESPHGEGDTARCPRTSCFRRRSSACTA